jgi:hypothetical protein
MRKDISDKLVHFTKGSTPTEAFETLRTIAHECKLIGSTATKGGYSCVCFSEAPLSALEQGLVNSSAYSRYAPFGVLFDKNWVFDNGGRPVIYQPDLEFYDLPESHKWRHVRYEPTGGYPIDFSWEREWRIKTLQLNFDPSVAALVVPEQNWADKLISEHGAEQDYKVMQYGQIMDEDLAIQYRETFKWLIYVLS